MTVPTKLEPVPSVAELPTCQKTLQACAPLVRLTGLADAVVERGARLEDEDGARVAAGVERERPVSPSEEPEL